MAYVPMSSHSQGFVYAGLGLYHRTMAFLHSLYTLRTFLLALQAVQGAVSVIQTERLKKAGTACSDVM